MCQHADGKHCMLTITDEDETTQLKVKLNMMDDPKKVLLRLYKLDKSEMYQSHHGCGNGNYSCVWKARSKNL